MKSVDLSGKIMEQVIRYEKQRTMSWFARYWLALLVLLLGVGASIHITIDYYRHADPEFFLGLYFYDWETITILWQDAFEFIWGLVPQEWIVIGGILALAVISVMLMTRGERKRVLKRMTAIRSYKPKAKGGLNEQ